MKAADYADATYIQASHFLAGRSGSSVEIIVLHTTEEPCAPGVARKVAGFFAGPSVTTSAHYIVGPDEVIQCVEEQHMAWHAQGANPQSIGIEHTARAMFTYEQWCMPNGHSMLERSARLAADICKRHGIPVQYVDEAGLVRREKGITMHVDVSRAFHKSDHSDPGRYFPFELWLGMLHEAVERG